MEPKASKHKKHSQGEKSHSKSKSSSTNGNVQKKKKKHKKRQDKSDADLTHGKSSNTSSPSSPVADVKREETETSDNVMDSELDASQKPKQQHTKDAKIPVEKSSPTPTKNATHTSQQPRTKPKMTPNSTKLSSQNPVSNVSTASQAKILPAKSPTKVTVNTVFTRSFNESFRWEYTLSEPEAEDQRINIYKQNRRKRYIADANRKYAEWLAKTPAKPQLPVFSGKGSSSAATGTGNSTDGSHSGSVFASHNSTNPYSAFVTQANRPELMTRSAVRPVAGTVNHGMQSVMLNC